MPLEDLWDWINATPFTPFRVTLSNGKTFDILRPEQMWPGRQSAVIGLGQSADDALAPRHVTISLLHINCVEPITNSQASEVGR